MGAFTTNLLAHSWRLFALLLSVPALAAPLNWDAAVRETSEKNADLQAAEASLRAAEASATAAYANFYPHVGASLGYSYGGPTGGPRTSGTSATLSAQQNLFNGLQDRAKADQAAAAADSARASLALTKATLSAELKGAFAGLAYSQNQVKLARDVANRRQDNLRLVELRFEGGRENKGSVLLSRAASSQAELERVQSENDLQTARDRLAKVLGRDESDGLEVSGNVPLVTPPTTPPDVRAIALETPEVRRIRAAETSAEAGAVSARAGFFPTLSLSGSLGTSDTSVSAREDRWSVGAALSIPLFDGGRDYYGAKAANASLGAARAASLSAIRDRVTALRDAWAGYAESALRLRVSRDFVEAARTRAEIARVQYNNGLSSFVDWDTIENDLITRQKTALQSERDRVTLEAAWEQAQGKGALP